MAFSAAASDGGAWASLPPALLTMPELLIARTGGRSLLTRLRGGRTGERPRGDPQPARGAPDRAPRAAAAAARPAPGGPVEVRSARTPASYEGAVATAVERIRGGSVEKVVLAREVQVTAPAAHSPGALFGALRDAFSCCFCFCVGTPEAAFVGASPELLVRRSGAVAATVALAGSARRSADPAVDDHLGEQLLHSAKDRSEHAIVARRIERRLGPVSSGSSGRPSRS